MNKNDWIKLGRKYAEGDGVMIDQKRAFAYWSFAADSLTGDELKLYGELGGIYADELAGLFGIGSVEAVSSVSLKRASGRTPRSADELKELFDDVMSQLTPEEYASFFNNMNRFIKDKVKSRDPHSKRTPEKIRFGNNLAFISHQCSWNRQTLMDKLNKGAVSSRKIDAQIISQIFNGVQGMADSWKMILVEQVNNYNENRKKGELLKRPVAVSDLDLPILELADIFRNIRMEDPKVRKLLENAKKAADM